MMLYLIHTMNRLKVSNLTFFQMAHQWCFGKVPDLHDDVAQFILHGVVPPYVKKYLDHIKQETT